MDLTPEVVFSLIQSGEEFPVDFDDAWRWIGYSTKGNAKAAFENAGLVEGIDFQVFMIFHKNSRGGRPTEKIKLTIDACKMFCMAAGTPKGREVRLYFLECERELKRLLQEESTRRQENTQKRLVSAMVSEEVVSRKPKFSDEFYELLYKKRGDGWEKRDPKKNRPACVGTWTNWTVYDRLLGGTDPGGVKEALNEVNPRIDGRRKDRHHWHLKGLGEFHLSSQLEVVKAVARLSPDGNWDKFMRNIQKACPNGEALQLNLLDMLEEIEPEAS
ncbi:MAG TPA: P63C domain-containing protein [Candidatus Obscuribacterales bacterium]